MKNSASRDGGLIKLTRQGVRDLGQGKRPYTQRDIPPESRPLCPHMRLRKVDGCEVCYDCNRYPDYWTWNFTR